MKNYTVKNGLSESNVNSIHKDSRGIVWIGTDGGLNRFNSFDFEVFKNDTTQYSLSNNVVYDITEDEFGTIWIGTANGLNAYVPEINGFDRFQFGEIDNVRQVLYDKNAHVLWLALMDGGLWQFNVKNYEPKQIDVFPEGALIQGIYQLDSDSLAIGTDNLGVFLLNTATHKTRRIHTLSENITLSDDAVNSITGTGSILVVGTNKGINLIDFDDESNTILSREKGNFSSDLIVCSTVDGEGYIWVGTDGGGINVIDTSAYSVKNYHESDINEYQLQSNVIREIHIDKSKNIWIGTYKKGFGIYNEKSNYLVNVNFPPGTLGEFGSVSVSSFTIDENEDLYIGLDGGGLFHWNGVRFKRIHLDRTCRDCNTQKVLSLEFDRKGNLWVGTFAEGVFCIYKNGEIRQFTKGKTTGLNSNSIWGIKQHSDGDLWLATNDGLCGVNIDYLRFENYYPETKIDALLSREFRTICIDYDGDIWLGSFFGVHVFDPRSRQFSRHYSSYDSTLPLSGNVIISMEELDKDKMVIGTYGQGFHVLDVANEKFQYEDMSNLFKNNVINFIEKGEGYNIWLGTNSGIATIDLENHTYNWYNSNNGLKDDVYNIGSGLIQNDSILFAGGISGFSILDASKLNKKLRNPSIVLEDVTYQNKDLSFNPYVNDKPPVFNISYSKSTLQISYSALDHFNAENIHFSYMLENFNKHWSTQSKYRQTSYTNLPPGTYHFKVKSSAFSSDNNLPVTLATIVVHPAWWMNTWFRVVGAFLFIILVIGIFQFRTNQHKNAERKLLKAVQEKTSEIARQKIELENVNVQLEDIVKSRTKELNDTINELNKTINELDRFVYSASHDLGAPLKSILGLINIAKLEVKDQSILPHLDFMQNSVKKLEEVIFSLIQYSRNNRLDLQIKEVVLHDLVEDCYDSLRFMNSFESIQFYNEIDKSIVILTDVNRMRIIIRNLLSNAVKYSDHEKERQWIRVNHDKPKPSKWKIIIEDNGVGIDKKHLKGIFKMFYRATESSDGSGLGLYITKEAIDKLDGKISVSSEAGMGTKMSINFIEKIKLEKLTGRASA